MKRLEVYFTNGRCAKFDLNKVCFRDGDVFFDFCSDSSGDGEMKTYPELIANGVAVVNWQAVSFVRPETTEEEEP